MRLAIMSDVKHSHDLQAKPNNFTSWNSEEMASQLTLPFTVPLKTGLLTTGPLKGLVLLVEDNVIIAREAVAMLMALGAQRVIVASNAREAFELINKELPTFALLDVHLGSLNSFPIAERLQKEGVAYIFASGYGSGINYPPLHQSKPFVTKPYTQLTLTTAINSLEN